MRRNQQFKNNFQEQFEESEANVVGYPGQESVPGDGGAGKAIQLLSIDSRGKITLNQEALEVLGAYEQNVGVVTLVGKCRTGKSFLLNKLLKIDQKGFRVDSSTKACTEGIWMWSQPMYNPNTDTYIFFMDTEGTDSLVKNTGNDSKIFALACLMASYFVYSSVGAIDERSLSDMEMITALSSQIKADQRINDRENDDKLYLYMPKFLWILKDFTLRIQDERGRVISANQYLENCLSDNRNASTQKTKKSITNYFKERECITLVQPTSEQNDLQRLETMPDYMLRKEYMEGISKLRYKILENTAPKTYNGLKVSGFNLCGMIESYVNSFNSGAAPSIKSAWEDTLQQEGAAAYNLALEKYQSVLKQQFPDDEPKGKEIYDSLKTLNQETMKEFNKYSPEHNQVFEDKLKAILSKKEKQLLEMNEEINYHRNKTILNDHSQKLKRKLEGGQYTDAKEFTRDMDQIKNRYEKDAKGDSKHKILNEFMMALTPAVSLIGKKKEPAVKSSYPDEQIEREKIAAAKKASLQNQKDAEASALAIKTQTKPKLSDGKKPIDPKEASKKDSAGCCGTKGCIIM